VIAPIAFPDGKTLREQNGIRFAIFPRVGGRAPDELSDEQLVRIGRLLGRIHNVAAKKPAPHRLEINVENYGKRNLEFLLSGNWIPLEYMKSYERAALEIFGLVEPLFENAATHRLHGDCHLGNLLWDPVSGPFFLDFDDMVRGPAVQDLWLLIPGRDADAIRSRAVLLEGYEEMRAFDHTSLRLIEPLRALRFIHYTAWIAKRWEDPAFPLAFPQFGTSRYWADETRDLEEQLRLIRENLTPQI
jgi:Ser/Thr protein kinase RdoA (MazF antagonist)